MLVRLRRTLRTDDGSTVISVLVVMLVLGIGGMVLALIVTNTTGVLADSRSTSQSRAAADAGITDAVALAKRGGSFCALGLSDALAAPGEDPTYAVSSTCDPASGTVTFTSVGRAGSGQTTARAVYTYTTGSTGHGADMVFYSDTTFTKEVITSNAANGLLSIVIPSGGFTCQVHVPANIITSGDIETNGSCTIDGNVRAGGKLDMSNTTDEIKGNATSSSTSTVNMRGRVGGDITVGGPLEFGWGTMTYPGNVTVGGTLNLTNRSIAGTLTIPKSGRVDYDGSNKITSPTATSTRIAGGLVWQDTVAPPAAPTFDPWFDYAYQLSDWRPFNSVTFTEIKLASSGNGPWTCNRFKDNNPSTSQAAGWRELAALTTPTIIDATACGLLSSNNGSNPDVVLGTDIVFVAKSFNLTTLRFTSKIGTKARVWYITNDGALTGSGDNVPSCSNGAGDIAVNHTDMADVVAMIYTPCTISVQGNSKWTGAFYGGGFSYGGGMTFVGANIALPGMPASDTLPGAGESSTAALGELVARRDVNP